MPRRNTIQKTAASRCPSTPTEEQGAVAVIPALAWFKRYCSRVTPKIDGAFAGNDIPRFTCNPRLNHAHLKISGAIERYPYLA